MNIVEYFDAQNPEHINAYLHIIKTGAWHEDFYKKLQEENITLHLNWQIDLVGKLSLEYVNLMKKNQDNS